MLSSKNPVILFSVSLLFWIVKIKDRIEKQLKKKGEKQVWYLLNHLLKKNIESCSNDVLLLLLNEYLYF